MYFSHVGISTCQLVKITNPTSSSSSQISWQGRGILVYPKRLLLPFNRLTREEFNMFHLCVNNEQPHYAKQGFWCRRLISAILRFIRSIHLYHDICSFPKYMCVCMDDTQVSSWLSSSLLFFVLQKITLLPVTLWPICNKAFFGQTHVLFHSASHCPWKDKIFTFFLLHNK